MCTKFDLHQNGSGRACADGNDGNKTGNYRMVKDAVHVCNGAALSRCSFDKTEDVVEMVHLYWAGHPSLRPRCLSGEMQRPYHVQIRPSEGVQAWEDRIWWAEPAWPSQPKLGRRSRRRSGRVC